MGLGLVGFGELKESESLSLKAIVFDGGMRGGGRERYKNFELHTDPAPGDGRFGFVRLFLDGGFGLAHALLFRFGEFGVGAALGRGLGLWVSE